MTDISRYIFRQLFVWTATVTLTLTCVVWLTQSLRFVNLIVNRGLSAPLFVWLTALLLPTFLLVILPIAAFCAVLFTYNKLVMDSELVVLRSAGLSQWALARPAMFLAAATALLGYGLSLYLLPASFQRFKQLQHEYRSSYAFVMLQEGVFNRVLDGVTVYVRERGPEGDLRGIIVHDSRQPNRPVTMMAARGAIVSGERGARVVMENGNRQEVSEKDGALALLDFDRYVFDIVEKKSQGAAGSWRDPNERYVDELLSEPTGDYPERQYRKYVAEGHYRLTAPALALAFVMIAVALLITGEFNRRGQWRRIALAALIVTALEASMVGIKNAAVNSPGLVFAMYPIVFLPLAVAFYSLGGRPRRRRRGDAPATA